MNQQIKNLIKHIAPHTSQGDHRQVQVTDSLIITLMGARDAKLSHASGQRGTRTMMTLPL